MSIYTTACDIDMGKITEHEWLWLHTACTTIESAPWSADNASYDKAGVCLGANGKPMFKKGSVQRVCSELPGIFEDGETNFGFLLQRDGEGHGSFTAETDGPNIDAVAALLDRFMKLFRARGYVCFSWGWMDGGDGGGGAVFISGKPKMKPEIISTANWLVLREKRHLRKRKK